MVECFLEKLLWYLCTVLWIGHSAIYEHIFLSVYFILPHNELHITFVVF